jgi:hypothetical protein
MRHDYGLDKHPDDADFVAGMLVSERNALWKQMAQIFDNNIAPHMVFKKPDPEYVAQVEEYFKNQHSHSE